MNAYQSNLNLQQAAQWLQGLQRVMLTTHSKPDGDAFGSVVATAALLTKLGKQVHAWFVPPVPASFAKLPGAAMVNTYVPGMALPQVDGLVVLDTGAWSQLSPLRSVLEPMLERTLIIDHHLSGDMAARWRCIDSSAAACCEVVADLADALGPGVSDPHVANALFVGIASDTGWFRFSNTSPRTHRLAARLLDTGVDHAGLYAQLEQTERVEKLRLLIRALDSLQLLAHEQAAVMVLRKDDFAQSGAWLEETERFVDFPQAVSTVKLVALITEPPDNGAGSPVRVSLRSKPGEGAVNVAALAARFGGGGHARAAGAKIDAPLDQVVRQVSEALVEAVR
jgi:phosphoesterase RecJ-like protein